YHPAAFVTAAWKILEDDDWLRVAGRIRGRAREVECRHVNVRTRSRSPSVEAVREETDRHAAALVVERSGRIVEFVDLIDAMLRHALIEGVPQVVQHLPRSRIRCRLGRLTARGDAVVPRTMFEDDGANAARLRQRR